MKTLGQLLKEWRDGKGLGVRAAARQCNMLHSHWLYIENDERPDLSVETLDKLHKGTGIRITTLLAACRATRERREAVPV